MHPGVRRRPQRGVETLTRLRADPLTSLPLHQEYKYVFQQSSHMSRFQENDVVIPTKAEKTMKGVLAQVPESRKSSEGASLGSEEGKLRQER